MTTCYLAPRAAGLHCHLPAWSHLTPLQCHLVINADSEMQPFNRVTGEFLLVISSQLYWPLLVHKNSCMCGTQASCKTAGTLI